MIYEIYTSAPKDYDGFSTETVAVVGHCTRSGNPVRKVRIEDRDFEWQTARYASGNNRYTNDRMTFLDYVKFGDWVATPEPTPAPIPEITPDDATANRNRSTSLPPSATPCSPKSRSLSGISTCPNSRVPATITCKSRIS
jgi:uncharacterized membrane protein